MQINHITYSLFKEINNSLNLQVGYVEYSNYYDICVVDRNKDIVYLTRALKDQGVDNIDFDTNLRPSATSSNILEDFITAQLVLNRPFYRDFPTVVPISELFEKIELTTGEISLESGKTHQIDFIPDNGVKWNLHSLQLNTEYRGNIKLVHDPVGDNILIVKISHSDAGFTEAHIDHEMLGDGVIPIRVILTSLQNSNTLSAWIRGVIK